jgi:hypothetical protein
MTFQRHEHMAPSEYRRRRLPREQDGARH